MDKRKAENTSSQQTVAMKQAMKQAQDTLDTAEKNIREDSSVFITLPSTSLPTGTKVLELHKSQRVESGKDGKNGKYGKDDKGQAGANLPEAIVMAGSERLRIAGPNGSGKTTLLEAIASFGTNRDQAQAQTQAQRPSSYDPHYVLANRSYIPQRVNLDPTHTVWESVAAANPAIDPQYLRDQLAQLLFQKDQINKRIAQLSGGEKFRVAVARELLSSPAPQLLILDEPTNNLDTSTIEWLTGVLNSYRGALILVSHDEYFCADVQITDVVQLNRAPTR